MADNWEVKSLERRIEALEKENRRRSERVTWWIGAVVWTFYVVALTAMITLAATGNIHHH